MGGQLNRSQPNETSRRTETSDCRTEVTQDRCAGVTLLAFDGELRLHVDLTTPASEDEDHKARNGENWRERDDGDEPAEHGHRQVEQPTKVVGELSINCNCIRP